MNPYRQNTLLEGMLEKPDRFIGLRDELEWVLARVTEERPAAISLVGPLGIGKSVLIRYLVEPNGARRTFRHAIGEQFEDDPEHLLFIRLNGGEPESDRAAKNCLMEVLFSLLCDSLKELFAIDDVRLIPLERITKQPKVRDLRAQIQRAIERVRNEADDQELYERFEQTIGTPSLDALLKLLNVLNGWGFRAIFVIDDFDQIAPKLSRADFDHLRVLLTAASLVIATRLSLSKLVPTEVQTSPFFNLVQRLGMRSLYFWPPEEAERLITEPPKWQTPQVLQFTKNDVKFILELTGLHPDLIRVVCEALYMRYARRSPTLGQDVIPESDRVVLRAQLGTLFADSFAALWHALPEDQRIMLSRIANDTITVDNSLTSTLIAVINNGYITCEKGRYRLFSLLFHDYVIEQTNAGQNLPLETEPRPVKAQLTELEQKLLGILAARSGSIVERSEIIAQLYPKASKDELHSHNSRLDALLFRLRGKLEGGTQQIESVRGQGYRLVSVKE